MKRGFTAAGIVVAVLILAVATITGWSVGRGLATHNSSPSIHLASQATPHYYLSIDTPAMLGGTEDTGPAYVPSTFTLPANQLVTLTVVNFDNATALPAQYAKTSGIVGPMTIQTLDSVHPNAAGTTTQTTSLDPNTGVAHTFTMPDLGLNVPIAPMSRVTFTFHTPAAGTYVFRCMDPCGTGPAGWNAAMSAEGFMEGHVTFA